MTGTSRINVNTANLKALGFNGNNFPPAFSGGFDEIIGLNTSISNLDGTRTLSTPTSTT